MLFDNVIVRIKRRENSFYTFLYNLLKKLLTSAIPVKGPIKLFYGALYNLCVIIRESYKWFFRFFFLEPMFRARCKSVGKGLYMERFQYIRGHGVIIIGDNFNISGKASFHVGSNLIEEPILRIGDNCQIGHNCEFTAASRISIGNNVVIGSGVRITDTDGHPIDAAKRRQKMTVDVEDIKPVEIKDDVWIGVDSYIGKGVVVSERSIIGAYSAVRKSVPPDTIVIGNPARVVGRIGDIILASSITKKNGIEHE